MVRLGVAAVSTSLQTTLELGPISPVYNDVHVLQAVAVGAVGPWDKPMPGSKARYLLRALHL